MLRAIHVFPDFTNVETINRLRAKYDSLVNLIPPHITLVFPFESDIPVQEMHRHVTECLNGLSTFRVLLQNITGATGGHLFLNVKVGNDTLIALHDKLYSGILRPFLNRTVTYIPHLTVGRVADADAFQQALADTEAFSDTFESNIHEVVIEEIDVTGKCIIQSRIPLQG